jgi:hypothetical protein
MADDVISLLKGWPAGEPVPAISIRQPWAAAVVWLNKDVENRSQWRFKYRGPVLIHASKAAIYAEDVDEVVKKAREAGAPESALKDFVEAEGSDVFAQGSIVGVACLTDVFGEADELPEDHPVNGSPWVKDDAPYWLYLADPVPCVPVPFRGQVGLFKVPYDVAMSLREPKYN